MIRRAELADASAIARVQVMSFHAAYRGLMPDAMLDAFTIGLRESKWQINLAEPIPGRVTSVLERDGRVIAFSTVGPSRVEIAPDLGEIWALYAAPGAWGSGAGRALLADGLALLASAGRARVLLWVLEGNARAIRFYEAGGFRLDGQRVEEDGLPHLRMSRDPIVSGA